MVNRLTLAVSLNDMQQEIKTVIASIHEETNRANERLARFVFNELAHQVTSIRHNFSDIGEAIKAISKISASILEHADEIQRLALVALINAQK
ncbi:hypothetical protein MHH70_03190 [Metasolibacillus sp. FSL H7-0170]|uniref:hypothetical protein n=1 Tax=Metasolibacillus TaxID=2703677 RepID=UPI000D3B0E4B|nr:hypothetical protein [Metasolibacillus fluoroglycofenilyticus]